MSATSPVRARKVASKSLLVTVIVAAAVGVVNVLWWGAFSVSNWRGGDWAELTVAVPEGADPDLAVGSDGFAQYSTVNVDADAGQEVWLHVAAVLLPFIVAGLICLAVILIAAGLLRGQQFGLGTAISLFVVALVTVGSGIGVPALNAAHDVAFAERLGLPLDGEQATTWVAVAGFDWQDCNWIMILLGLLIALGGWLVLRARKLRQDMEGTI
ncbi:MAG: hypothetical protein ACTMIK_09505 [Galactobacter sp.]